MSHLHSKFECIVVAMRAHLKKNVYRCKGDGAKAGCNNDTNRDALAMHHRRRVCYFFIFAQVFNYEQSCAQLLQPLHCVAD